MCFGVASKESERGIDVPQDAECSVHGDVLEKRAWVEDALKLCGGEALGVQGELLDTVQTLAWGSGCCLVDTQIGSRPGNGNWRWIGLMTWCIGAVMTSVMCVAPIPPIPGPRQAAGMDDHTSSAGR